MFIIFIGLKNAGIVVSDPATFVAMGSLKNAAPALALIGIFITIALLLKNIKGALLIGIIVTWVLGIAAQAAGWYQVDPAAGSFSLIPDAIVSLPPSLAPTFGLFVKGFGEIFTSAGGVFSFLSVMITFLFVDIFDTVGTLAGVASKAQMLNEAGELEKSDEALLADAIGTTVGAVLGTSTVTTYIESAAGVQEGGRSGLTAIVTSIFFLLSLVLSPIFLTIPGFATATALVVVGILMMEPISKLKLEDLEDLLPLGVTAITMPLFYSISEGLAYGFTTYVVVKLAKGKFKDISVLMWVLTVIFLIQMILTH
jgi:AGZA family xanthine/uracil permease-like MFS transporter